MGDLHRLIVFDLDGTLIDSRRDLADAANALIVEHGGAPLAETDIGRMVGEGARVLVERALTAAGLSVVPGSLARFLELYDERLLNTTRVYEGIPAVLQTLMSGGCRLAVLTNKPSAPSERILEALGLTTWVKVTIGGDAEFPKKPDPAALQHLMRTFDAGPGRTVMVGDSWIDHETARRAGTKACVARYGFGFENFPAHRPLGDAVLVDEPAALPGALDLLLAEPPEGSTGR